LKKKAAALRGVAAFFHSDTQFDALFAVIAPVIQWELSSPCMIDQPT
jgi:hypothetical protein